MSTADVLKACFHRLEPEAEYIEETREALGKLGFTRDNSIACVGICRDEISQPLIEVVQRSWGHAFDLSSLAGMFFAGKTGLTAAMHHAPNLDGKERYVFYSLPHIAIDGEGRLGVCVREGRLAESGACGALGIFQKELAQGRVSGAIENDDIEMSLIRIRLSRELAEGESPDLLELTKTVQRAVQADLERALKDLIDTSKSDYAVITGIQVHAPDGNYIAPVAAYAYIGGVRQEL